jgi:hypothetical protein
MNQSCALISWQTLPKLERLSELVECNHIDLLMRSMEFTSVQKTTFGRRDLVEDSHIHTFTHLYEIVK